MSFRGEIRFTEAGRTWYTAKWINGGVIYGKDPHDSNIRIAPTYPTPEELSIATDIFVLSVKLVSIDKLLGSL